MNQFVQARSTISVRDLTAVVLVLWFLLAVVGSWLGVFDSTPRPPILLGLAAVVPVALFGVGYLASARFREFLLSLDLRMLTFVQTWRVGGIVFLLLYQQGLLPGVFALPAGWGDFAIGITAPIMAWSWRPPFPYRTFVVWNALGLLDLVMAVTLGLLASATPLGVLAGEVTTRLMGQFPLSLIPTFFVPLLVICHLISLDRAYKRMP
jgi:hypothetical protein